MCVFVGVQMILFVSTLTELRMNSRLYWGKKKLQFDSIGFGLGLGLHAPSAEPQKFKATSRSGMYCMCLCVCTF